MLAYFLNPWMLAAMVAVSIPLIIELLHRLRRRIIPFAAMRYLKMEKQKKVRMQDLLLLILRSIAVFLLVLALARPFLKAGTMLWAGGAGG
ncbi:MAG: BatA domain-containing protein, partial [Planctomycetota bacterium]|nr:BatA domain-containing protein [Planctomycetota bacterium]